jgi:hypothetical protein
LSVFKGGGIVEIGDIITMVIDGNPIEQKIVDIQTDENGNITGFTAVDVPIE